MSTLAIILGTRAGRAAVAAALMLALLSPLSAQTRTVGAQAQDLLQACEAPNTLQGEKSWARLACLSYLKGFLDGYGMAAGDVMSSAKLFCFPPSGRPEQARRVFVKWGHVYPEYLHQSWHWAVLAALKEAFPCPK